MTTRTVFATPAELGAALAREITDGISAAAVDGRKYLLGCPGGRSARPVYLALAHEIARRQLDLSHVVIVMMDEYVVEIDGEYRNVDPVEAFSVVRFGIDEIVTPLSAAGTGTPDLWTPDAHDPQRHEDRIAAAGIDLFILATGSSDGHVAFNTPGTAVDAQSRVVALPESTRTDNVRTHPDFKTADGVPPFGVTVGTGTIAQYSARAVLVAHGAEKQTTADRLSAGTGYDPQWPASIVHECRQPSIFLDKAAAGEN
ncbi:MAG: 6-phosphogluconolactonase [Nakamurella sp.]